MKKSIKIIVFLVVSLPLLIGFSACSDDDDKYYMPAVYWATVNTGDDGLAESFILDNGEKLYVQSTSTSYKPENQRVAISFNVLEDKKEGYDYVIHLVGYFGDVLTKPIIYVPADDDKLQDSIGHNKIKIFSSWGAGNYLNFRYGYNTSRDGKHMLNLLADEEGFEHEGDEPIELTFRHKVVEGQELYASGEMFVSFKLDDYIKANKGKRDYLIFNITWEEYSGEVKTKKIKIDLPKDIEKPVEPENSEE